MKKCLVLIALFLSLFVHADTHNCFPKNNRLNPVTNNKSIQTGISKEQFEHSIKLAKSVYSPIFKEKYGAELVVEEKWDDATVNAYAQQSGSKWMVSMFGGLARDPLVTKDGFTAVICHEIGHHVGGAPKGSSWSGPSWASNEGQSDYFATSKCLRKIYEQELSETIRFYTKNGFRTVSEDRLIARKACDEAYETLAERAVCFRSALAGESLAQLLGKLGGNANVKFGTPDASKVAKTNHAHPKGQCRMDTYFAGALCDVDHKVWPSMTDAAEGYCTAKEKQEIGLRPLCWFNPKEYGVE